MTTADRFEAFRVALEELLRQHDVSLFTSEDGVIVAWDTDPQDRDLPDYTCGTSLIENRLGWTAGARWEYGRGWVEG